MKRLGLAPNGETFDGADLIAAPQGHSQTDATLTATATKPMIGANDDPLGLNMSDKQLASES